MSTMVDYLSKDVSSTTNENDLVESQVRNWGSKLNALCTYSEWYTCHVCRQITEVIDEALDKFQID